MDELSGDIHQKITSSEQLMNALGKDSFQM